MYHSAVLPWIEMGLPWMEIGAVLLAGFANAVGGELEGEYRSLDEEAPFPAASPAGTCVMFPQTGQRAIFPACSPATLSALPHPPQGISSKSVMAISLLQIVSNLRIFRPF
jgi:hypothetical protein